ncbi:pyrroline-5-carboxylate reductase [Psychromicrobium xiongbiense]|uniref:pyrroline-5-carboxylate reductase n=1 Tax=Psychromicrobium xiongbiense TaxID=3051184 RepID=UPI002554594F|nr:pyrroline-5-carboxylate reductase [Psychromicrobium sp. YIM S02556]
MISRIAFLGCGSMGEAVLAGLLSTGLAPSVVVATVRRPERAQELTERYGVSVLTAPDAEGHTANSQAVRDAQVVVLGVKPAQIADLCAEIGADLSPNAVVVSVAAAVSLEQMARALPAGQPAVRSMPNTPLMVGRGVVGLSNGPTVTEEQAGWAREVFAGSGVVLEIPEAQMAALSAISGSGPAYVFYLAEALAQAGVSLGLDPEVAEVLGRETVAGAGLMLAQDGADAATLRRKVTSPNGTTERAIAVFDAHGLPRIIAEGAAAAVRRSEELTEQLGG